MGRHKETEATHRRDRRRPQNDEYEEKSDSSESHLKQAHDKHSSSKFKDRHHKNNKHRRDSISPSDARSSKQARRYGEDYGYEKMTNKHSRSYDSRKLEKGELSSNRHRNSSKESSYSPPAYILAKRNRDREKSATNLSSKNAEKSSSSRRHRNRYAEHDNRTEDESDDNKNNAYDQEDSPDWRRDRRPLPKYQPPTESNYYENRRHSSGDFYLPTFHQPRQIFTKHYNPSNNHNINKLPTSLMPGLLPVPTSFPPMQPQPLINRNLFNNTNNNNIIRNININSTTQVTQFPTQPRMLSQREFVALHLDPTERTNKLDEVRHARYAAYKEAFRAEQTRIFFDEHKHEEWFRVRYHPSEVGTRRAQQRAVARRRLAVFVDAWTLSRANDEVLTLSASDSENMKRVVKFLDTCLVKLEGGDTAQDMAALALIYNERKETETETAQQSAKKEKVLSSKKNIKRRTKSVKKAQKKSSSSSSVKKNREESDVSSESGLSSTSSNTTSEISSANSSESDEENGRLHVESKVSSAVSDNEQVAAMENSKKAVPSPPRCTQSLFFKQLPVDVTRFDLEKVGKQFTGFKRVALSEPAPERGFYRRAWLTFDAGVDIFHVCAKINKIKIQNGSISLNAQINREVNQKVKFVTGLTNHRQIVRNDLCLACKIVENMDRKWGVWKSSEDRANEETAAEGSSTLLREGQNVYLAAAKEYLELLEQQSKQTSSLVKTDAAIQQSPGKMRSPSKMETNEAAAREIETNLQIEVTYKNESSQEETKKSENLINVVENKPSQLQCHFDSSYDELILVNEEENLNLYLEESSNITEKVSEENNKKQENTELLDARATTVNTKTATESASFDLDEQATRLLDTLILYLRIVFSFDFYNATEYQQEDQMPYRCGLLHVRASHLARSNPGDLAQVIYGEQIRVGFDPSSPVRQRELDEWCRLFALTQRVFVDASREILDIEIARRLGLREPAEACAAFITANCLQIDEQVWLCPISDKRFKGPDYVRKHIETKHAEKLAEVRADCEYFNRFLLDPKRPYLPEHPLSRNPNGPMAAGNNVGNSSSLIIQPTPPPSLMSINAAGGPAGGAYCVGPPIHSVHPLPHAFYTDYDEYAGSFYEPSTPSSFYYSAGGSGHPTTQDRLNYQPSRLKAPLERGGSSFYRKF